MHTQDQNHAAIAAPAGASSGPSGRDAHAGGRLSACVLLAGGLRPSRLVAQSGVPVPDLTIAPDATVLEHWLAHLSQLGRELGHAPPVRVVCRREDRPLSIPRGPEGVRCTIETEAQSYRGPAGVVRDACETLDAGATILVGESARVLTEGLTAFVRDHHERNADITVGCNADRSPAGVYLMRRSSLDLVPQIGFMDLKEQWLTKAVTQGLHVRIHRFTNGRSFPLRSREEFLAGAFARHAASTAGASNDAPRSIVAHGAEVEAGAFVHDSVVMCGARVGPQTVVVRSLVLPGGSVPRGAVVIDQVVRGR